MTLYHFGNCLALVYAPYHMAYKFSGIQEYSTFSKCVYAGGLYIFTQLCKMLLLATFFPDSDGSQAEGQFDVFLEILKATVDLADLMGLYFALNAVPGKGHAKIFTAAIGWASAEMLVSRSVPLWVGARGAEFSWRPVVLSALAGAALLGHAATAALLWLWPRYPQHRRGLGALIVLTPYGPVLERAAGLALGLAGAGAGSGAGPAAMRVAHVAARALAAAHLYAVSTADGRH